MPARVRSVLRKAALVLAAGLAVQALAPAAAVAAPFRAMPALGTEGDLPLVQVRNGRNAALIGGAIAGLAAGAILAAPRNSYAQPYESYGAPSYSYGAPAYSYGAPAYAPEPYAAAPSYEDYAPEPSYSYGRHGGYGGYDGYAPAYAPDPYVEAVPAYRPRRHHYYEVQRKETFYRDPWGGPTTRILPEGK